jgi:hypothetical protein
MPWRCTVRPIERAFAMVRFAANAKQTKRDRGKPPWKAPVESLRGNPPWETTVGNPGGTPAARPSNTL